MELDFEWDEDKAKANLRKHKVGFETAKTVFADPFLQTLPDDEHSNEEQRFINIGRSTSNKTLIVIHTERAGKIRIISCRKATAAETEFYEEGI